MQAQKMDAIGRLAGGVAHDFNNLLTAIGGYADLVSATFDPSDPRQAHVTGIRQATEHAASLTRQLLTFSRGQELRPSPISLSQVVTTVEPMLRRLLGEPIELVVKTDPGAWLTLADRSQVEAILINLAVNARDAMPDGGTLTIETANVPLDEGYQLHHAEVKPGDYAALTVTDTGVGMDAATMAHIFEPFFTTKAARLRDRPRPRHGVRDRPPDRRVRLGVLGAGRGDDASRSTSRAPRSPATRRSWRPGRRRSPGPGTRRSWSPRTRPWSVRWWWPRSNGSGTG